MFGQTAISHVRRASSRQYSSSFGHMVGSLAHWIASSPEPDFACRLLYAKSSLSLNESPMVLRDWSRMSNVLCCHFLTRSLS